jgi:hypothetical protein
MGNFLRDRAQSEVAVEFVLDWLIDRGITAHELEGTKEQKSGDIRCYLDGDLEKPVDLEIKYDMMSERTGNLCFEVSNGKGMTGVCKTNADKIVYVCPDRKKKELTLFFFHPETLKSYLFDTLNSSKVKIKKGGDGRKFILAIVNKQTIIDDKICSEQWTVPSA